MQARNLPFLAATLWVGCGGGQPASLTGLSSLRVTMVDPPADKLGTPGAPIRPASVTIDVDAIDVHGQPWPASMDVDVYISFAGNKIGQFTACGDKEDQIPLTTIHLDSGSVKGLKLKLPRAFGVSALWLEESQKDGNARSYAVGTSPPIYFSNPTIPDVQTPLDVNAPQATYCSTFNGKHILVDQATGKGRLVVTSAFINSYVVADTGANFDLKTGTGGFNHLYVFSFGRPPEAIVPGRIMTHFSGNMSKFVGFSELNFPLQEYADTVDPALMPPVIPLGAADRPYNQANNLKLLRLSGATVSLSARLCAIDPNGNDWRKYSQFAVDLGSPSVCDPLSTFVIVLPGKTFGDFDPLALPQGPMGAMATYTGMLKNSSGQNDVSTPPVSCDARRNLMDGSNQDCADAGFMGASCVEGNCKKGAYNFWSIQATSVTVHP